MMYNSKLVASIKANGKVLREFKDTIYIPFGSEYSVLLKNLNTVRALINVYIDGDNVVPGGLVLNAGQEIDLERAIRNGNLSEGNRFKFIERTGKIEDHRGIKLEDGLIRVEFQFEKVYPKYPNKIWKNINHVYYDDLQDWNPRADGMVRGSVTSQSSTAYVNASYATSYSAPQSETGITVPGSKSEQKFTTTGWFATETETHNIILKLLGETPDNMEVREPITVKTKPKCVTCGKQNRATDKFCSECGTFLEIFA